MAPQAQSQKLTGCYSKMAGLRNKMNAEKLKLVARLARQGEPGERDVALRILGIAGVSLEDIPQEEEVEVEFIYKTALEKQLIVQTYCKLTNSNVMNGFRISSKRGSVFLPADMVDRFRQDVSTILSLWRKELKRFFEAFIQANRLFSDLPSDSDFKISIEELQEIMVMARSIKRATLGRLLNEKNTPDSIDRG
jgi:hypothetical protein